MTDKPRARPYVWVSWLTKLIAGENRCWWSAWYKAHHKYEKTADQECAACREGRQPCEAPDTCRAEFFREWTAKHDRITERRAEELREDDYVVRVEEDASFKLVGRGADVAGKPDLVAVRGGEALVVDAKAGRARSSDHWQVLVYMFALPLSWISEKIRLRGEVAYAGVNEPVRPLGEKEREAIVHAIKRVSDPEEPARVPSLHECSRCDVAACPDRVRSQGGDATRYF